MKETPISILWLYSGSLLIIGFWGKLSNINMITNCCVLVKHYTKVCLGKNAPSLLQFWQPVLYGGGEWYGDLQMDSLTKSTILYVLHDLPGSLEDQRDPVHLFHLGHPGSDRKDSINNGRWHHYYLVTSLLDWKKEMAILQDYIYFRPEKNTSGRNTHLWSRRPLSTIVTIRTWGTLKCLTEKLRVTKSQAV